jgi:ElaA protein
MLSSLQWQWKTFQQFTDPSLFYEVLKLRSKVFVLEQQCPYLDLDDLDQKALHLLGLVTEEGKLKVVTYARLFVPNADCPRLKFGRVVVDPSYRGKKLGEALVAQMLDYIKTSDYQNITIEISAQHYLISFYRRFGFEVSGEPYDEDGILHIKMIKK